jgi:outer membrane protein TolC
VPIWDWGVNRAQVQAAKVAVETNEYDLTELRKTIVREVASAIDAVREAWNRLEVLEKSESVAARSYEISLKRFENGELTTQELVLDQQRLTNARQAFLSAFISYKLAIADLTRKTMFDFEKGRSLAK